MRPAAPRSPLRYAGGKTRGVETIMKFIPDGETICSPFLGGGSVELACANKGMRVDGYDNFKPLVEFWQCILKDPAKLADTVQHHYPLPKEEFYALQKSQGKSKSKYERAARFYVLNRASFSGTTMSGGMSPNHPRFTKSSIDRIRNFEADNLSVRQADFKESIPESEEHFLYLDPPYMLDQKLYGRNGDMHAGFDHEGLAEILKGRDKWILSYNNSEEVRHMYGGYQFYYPKWSYGMSNDKEARELLVLSHDVAERSRDLAEALAPLCRNTTEKGAPTDR
ncbi:MAG: DNA adenine methylase [Nitrosopumilaceae archaeon]|nr:DNA adenine methylase [Nitrosopumilaceae archaeon]